VALLVMVAWMLNFGIWGFVYCLNFFVGSVEMELISFLFVLAALTRSARIPFYTCSSAAMATTTRFSALLHSSALVTVGVC